MFLFLLGLKAIHAYIYPVFILIFDDVLQELGICGRDNAFCIGKGLFTILHCCIHCQFYAIHFKFPWSFLFYSTHAIMTIWLGQLKKPSNHGWFNMDKLSTESLNNFVQVVHFTMVYNAIHNSLFLNTNHVLNINLNTFLKLILKSGVIFLTNNILCPFHPRLCYLFL